MENLCLGLVEIGLKKGDRVVHMGDPCPELCYAELAPQCAGGISFGIYPTTPSIDVKYYMEDSEAKFFIGEDQEYIDKILDVADELPNLERIIVSDDRAMFMYSHPKLMTLKEVEQIGAEAKKRNPNLFEELISQVKIDDIAVLTYTSGTTGRPKGSIATHRNWLYGWYNYLNYHPIISDEGACTVGATPLAHIVGRLVAIYGAILGGYVIAFPEAPETTEETIFEVSPDFLVGAPRTFEKWAARVSVDLERSNWIKRKTYNIAERIGRAYLSRRWGGKVSRGMSILYHLGRWIAFRPILDKLGLLKAKVVYIGAAPVTRQVITLFQMWGLNILELYGATEGGNISRQAEAFSPPGNAGVPLIGTEIRISDRDEAVIRNGSFTGYWRREAATAEMFKNGWVYTGDAVLADSGGNIKIYDRTQDVLLTSSGKVLSPTEVEKVARGSPFISDAAAFGDGHQYLTALIEIDFDTMADWARDNGILYTSFTSLATHPRTYELIDREVNKANSLLTPLEQIKSFRILPKELDPDEITDPITPTRKIQRKKIYQRFKDLADSMYTKEEASRVRAKFGEEIFGEIRMKEA